MDIVASIDCDSDILAEGRAKAGEAESVGFLEREQCKCTASGPWPSGINIAVCRKQAVHSQLL